MMRRQGPETGDKALPQTDSELRDILAKTRILAVVGIKDDATQDAHRVPAYMQGAGYRIVPINPKIDLVLGERAVASLGDVSGPVDMVNLFRASDHIPAHVEEILALSPRPLAVWMQLGIHNGGAAAKLRAAGIQVIQDRCIMVEHRRLLPVEDTSS
jgi:predicted CoA-binding protein